MLSRILRFPIFHFMLLGALILVLRAWSDRHAPEKIVVSADRVTQLFAEVGRHGGGSPDEAERTLLLAKAEEEELFFQAALDLGMVQQDQDVRDRLQALGRFAGSQEGGSSEAALARALELDLHRRDAQVRSWLVEDARRFLLAPGEEPETEVLKAFLAANPERFRQPPSIRFSQVFLDRRLRRRTLQTDARLLLKRLVAEPFSPQLVDSLSDPSKLALHTGDLSPEMVERRFGPMMAQALDSLEPDTWHGPLESEAGLHLVWIHEIHRGEIPAFAEIAAAVRQVWLADQLETKERESLESLRRHYRVRFQMPALVGPASPEPAREAKP